MPNYEFIKPWINGLMDLMHPGDICGLDAKVGSRLVYDGIARETAIDPNQEAMSHIRAIIATNEAMSEKELEAASKAISELST